MAAACAVPEVGTILLGSPAVRGRCPWLCAVLAKRAKQRLGHLRGQHEREGAPAGGKVGAGPERLPDRGQAGFGSYRGSSLPSGVGVLSVCPG